MIKCFGGEPVDPNRRVDVARYLAALRVHYAEFGAVSPLLLSDDNMLVPVEVVALIGKLLVGGRMECCQECGSARNSAARRGGPAARG